MRLAILLTLAATTATAQVAGNSAYNSGGSGHARAQALEAAVHTLTKEDLPPTPYSMYIDAHILANVKADDFVATFALAQEGATVDEAATKMDATLHAFIADLHTLHLRDADIFVDYIAEPRIYAWDVANNTQRERLTGFELKKNVIIHYAQRDLLDKLIAAAASHQIYDLVKVDYVVKDTTAVEDHLRSEAAEVIHAKLAAYQKLLGLKTEPTLEIIADRSEAHYPTSLYDSYSPAEAEPLIHARYESNTTIEARKTRSFYFNPLDPSGFDRVLNPLIIEPVVQFTLYLKVKYDAPHPEPTPTAK